MTYPLWCFALLFGVMIACLFLGIPVALALGGIATVAIIIIWGFDGTYVLANSAFSTFSTDTYLAIAMFLLMGNILQRSGIADDLYEMLYKWMGGIRGGLAMGTVVICAIFGAMCGGSGPATITMGLIALPSMLKRGYSKFLAMGCIAVGGVLGIIIPPSIPMIILATYGNLSVGKLFFGGVLPGIMCAIIYMIYIFIICNIKKDLGPVVPKEERASWGEKIRSLTAMIGPVILIILVLGSIYTGAATPTEAAAVGALGSFIIALLKRKLGGGVFGDILKRSFIITGMVLWILVGANLFNIVYNYMGAYNMLINVTSGLPGGKWTVLILMLALNFILGCLMDDFAIITLTAPLYLPIINSLGFDPLWFGLVFLLNLQMAYLTPPFGFNLFYLKSVVPKEIKLTDIYKSVLPFIALQIIALLICIFVPDIITWLPNKMIA